MRFQTVTIAQSGQNSPAFDTQGDRLAGLIHYVSSFDGTPTFKLQTPAYGEDPSNGSAVWIDVLEISPGIRSDADDAGTLSAETTRNLFGLPNELLAEGGDEFFLIPSRYIPQFSATDQASTVAEGDAQRIANQVARLSNYRVIPSELPRIMRIAIGANQTTAARDFILAFNSKNEPFSGNRTRRAVRVTFANGDADSSYFELAPGEQIVGIETPAAFTSTTLTLQSVKPTVDPVPLTDANWLNLVDFPYQDPNAASTSPSPILSVAAVQGKYHAIGVLPYPELPQFVRLHGSGNQGAARTVTVYIQ